MGAISELRRASGAMRCLQCGKCSTLCPLSAFGDFSAARMAAIHDPGSEYRAHARTVDRCLTCGACELRCPQSVKFTEFVRGVRGAIPAKDRSPCPHGTALQAAARLGATAADYKRDLRWMGEGLRTAERGEVALFVGCLPLFDAMFSAELGMNPTEIARSAIRLMNLAGIEPVVIAEERCCGHDLLWGGDDATFAALAAQNAAAFETRGVKHIVSACAECTRTWKIDYAAAVPSYKPKVEHLSEFLARLAAEGAMPFLMDESPRVTFQDPCRLARHIGVTDAPRELLGAMGAEVVEMTQHGADAQCCGTAGFLHCDRSSRQMQESRLREAAETGAEVLLTACPKCWIHFACAQREDVLRGRTQEPIQVEDLTLFAARRAAERGAAR